MQENLKVVDTVADRPGLVTLLPQGPDIGKDVGSGEVFNVCLRGSYSGKKAFAGDALNP
jgi:hypothetical protein